MECMLAALKTFALPDRFAAGDGGGVGWELF